MLSEKYKSLFDNGGMKMLVHSDNDLEQLQDLHIKKISDTGNRTPSCRVLWLGIMRGGNVSRYTISDYTIREIKPTRYKRPLQSLLIPRM